MIMQIFLLTITNNLQVKGLIFAQFQIRSLVSHIYNQAGSQNVLKSYLVRQRKNILQDTSKTKNVQNMMTIKSIVLVALIGSLIVLESTSEVAAEINFQHQANLRKILTKWPKVRRFWRSDHPALHCIEKSFKYFKYI